MPRAAEVTTRALAPEMTAYEEENSHLYRPVPQLDGDPPFEIEYLWFTPEKAKEWLAESHKDPNFANRPIRLPQVRRWKNLIKTDRLVHFLPASPICIDPDGVGINGYHRMTALSGMKDVRAGFMVVKKVPRWMFAFFDTNTVRTVQDVFAIGGRSTTGQTKTATRLGMRYEEFLTGRRNPGGWRNWNQVSDEHQDVDQFLVRRPDLQDWHAVADRIKKPTKILPAASMVFLFYQGLAWPEGQDVIEDYVQELVEPKTLSSTNPPHMLRRWTNDTYAEKAQVYAKRETHLFLMFQTFGQFARHARIDSLRWAYGMPMTMPYHPKGFEVGIKNVRAALDEMDASLG